MVVVEPFKRLCNFGLRRKNLECWNSNVNLMVLILKRDFVMSTLGLDATLFKTKK
jgi:hypothetical protein